MSRENRREKRRRRDEGGERNRERNVSEWKSVYLPRIHNARPSFAIISQTYCGHAAGSRRWKNDCFTRGRAGTRFHKIGPGYEKNIFSRFSGGETTPRRRLWPPPARPPPPASEITNMRPEYASLMTQYGGYIEPAINSGRRYRATLAAPVLQPLANCRG